ncbi:MAG TPA: hypothetical protein VN690_05735 [Terriglobales bacterium]|nr:hypothetical protein [Terriglobales bacterium]
MSPFGKHCITTVVLAFLGNAGALVAQNLQSPGQQKSAAEIETESHMAALEAQGCGSDHRRIAAKRDGEMPRTAQISR